MWAALTVISMKNYYLTPVDCLQLLGIFPVVKHAGVSITAYMIIEFSSRGFSSILCISNFEIVEDHHKQIVCICRSK